MARSLNERQQAELTEFVNELAVRAGYTTTAAWSVDSGYPASNLSEVRNGKAAIDGYNLLRLIRAAAEQAETIPTDLALEASQSDDGSFDAAIALRLEVLAVAIAEGLARLGADVSLEEIQRRLEAERAQGSDQGGKAMPHRRPQP